MTFAVTIPAWAIDTFMVLVCAYCILATIKTAMEIYLFMLEREVK